jgi:hypothetical protein
MIYSHQARAEYLKRLHDDWQNLADELDIPSHERRRFRQGEEPRAIWDWLEARTELARLPDALEAVNRPDLAMVLREEDQSKPTPPSPPQPKWLRWVVIAVAVALVAGVALAVTRPWEPTPRPDSAKVVSGTAKGLAGRYRGDFTSTISGTQRPPYSNYVSLTKTAMSKCTDVGLDEQILPGVSGDCYSGMWYADANHTGQMTGGPVYFRNERVAGRLGIHGIETDGTCRIQEYTARVRPQVRPTYSGTWTCDNAIRDHAAFELVQLSPSP